MWMVDRAGNPLTNDWEVAVYTRRARQSARNPNNSLRVKFDPLDEHIDLADS